MQDEEEKGVFHFMELYSSQTALVEHNERQEVRDFASQVRREKTTLIAPLCLGKFAQA